jgi:CBS domain-containing protein
MKVEKYASREVIAASPGETVSHVRNLMLKNNISRVLIIGEEPLGIVTKKDLARQMSSDTAPWRRRPIDSISINRVMTTGLITIPSNALIKEAASIMLENDISSLPVVDDSKRIKGILTKTDIVRAYFENYRGRFKVKDLMSSRVVTVNRLHTINHIIEVMEEKRVGRVIVIDGGKPVGIITASDLSFFDPVEPKRGMKRKESVLVRKPGRGERPRYRHIRTFLATAEDVMSTELITIESRKDAADAAHIILEKGISALPVIDKDKLVGIITKTDIVRGISMGK